MQRSNSTKQTISGIKAFRIHIGDKSCVDYEPAGKTFISSCLYEEGGSWLLPAFHSCNLFLGTARRFGVCLGGFLLNINLYPT